MKLKEQYLHYCIVYDMNVFQYVHGKARWQSLNIGSTINIPNDMKFMWIIN